ncbi:MAG: TetR/AcrR family transcriptional regulator [Bradyrhizobium sp.]|jgi:AcrR family transcriptional regulator|uniref:TetR/AcrR family transcriptional regulator n=1 Tax=Bradyrhizobium sp. TaxID=376 RepID=UPI003C7C3A01
MAEPESSSDRRCRGRPQLRSDDETRQIIYEAARHEFAANGFAATSTEKVARRAGVSTKTLYRLIPSKTELFEGMVSDRLDRFLADVNLRTAARYDDIEQALTAALLACMDLVLDPEVVALQRIVLQETGNTSLARTYYKDGILRTATTLASWLKRQVKQGLIQLDDPDEVAGMLIGMVASSPQRATVYGGLPLPARAEIEKRVATCARLFLRGCRASG